MSDRITCSIPSRLIDYVSVIRRGEVTKDSIRTLGVDANVLNVTYQPCESSHLPAEEHKDAPFLPNTGMFAFPDGINSLRVVFVFVSVCSFLSLSLCLSLTFSLSFSLLLYIHFTLTPPTTNNRSSPPRVSTRSLLLPVRYDESGRCQGVWTSLGLL